MMLPSELADRYGPEYAIMVLLLRWQAGKLTMQEVCRETDRFKPDPGKLCRLVDMHQLPHLCFRSGFYEQATIDRGPFQRSREEYLYRGKFNLVILEAFRQVSDLIRHAGVDVLFYKGLVLGQMVYADVTTRVTSDIDMLIHAEDFSTLSKLLRDAGYEDVYRFPAPYEAYLKKINREALFRRRAQNGQFIYIELQWAPLPKWYGVPYHNDLFFAESEVYKLAGIQIRVPSPTLQFMLLIIHHGIGDLWRKGRHYADIAAFYRVFGPDIDLDRIAALFRKWHLQRNVAAGMEALEQMTGLNIPLFRDEKNSLRDAHFLLQSLLREDPLPKSAKSRETLSRQWRLSGGVAGRTRLLAGYAKAWLAPSLIDLQQYQFSKPFFPLYFITKRFRFLTRKQVS